MQARKRDPNKVSNQGWKHLEKPEPELPEIPTKKVSLREALGQTVNGRRKYICLDCKKPQMIHWTERARIKRTQCRHCGSYHLEPATAGALLELQRADENLHGVNPTIKIKGS